ncbi:hypothetical protein M9458_052276 [Cirrhinus mrigala]|uniref:Uncharacterized protein n=1 Tax=Cirrhinus mrigala TaxID=683832 RepID=A0ABD0MWU4_CIRMR
MGEGVSGKSTAETWPFFVLMDEVSGQRPSNNPPVLIASIPGETLGPSSAVGDHEEEPAPPPPPTKKRRARKDELVELLREDMRFQRETEERRARESRENGTTVFSS